MVACTATSPALCVGLTSPTHGSPVSACKIPDGHWSSFIVGPAAFLGGKRQMSPSPKETLVAAAAPVESNGGHFGTIEARQYKIRLPLAIRNNVLL